MAFRQSHVWQAVEERFERGATLQPRQLRSEAHIRRAAEREVLLYVGTVDVQFIRILKDRLVALSGVNIMWMCAPFGMRTPPTSTSLLQRRVQATCVSAVGADDSEAAVAATDLVVSNFERNVRRALKSDSVTHRRDSIS